MSTIVSAFTQVWHNITGVLSGIGVGDVLDILILAFLIYKAIQLIQETHAGQLLKGIVILVVADIIAYALNMTMVTVLLHSVWSIGLIALIVLFQPELRHVLEQIGKSNFKAIGKNLTAQELKEHERIAIDAVCKACSSMASSKTGALIVFEQGTILSQIINNGSLIDAEVSSELLCNIFFNKAPLHDGAVVIRGGRIASAGCILPLTQQSELDHQLGTRHRAAIGMSEHSDAFVVVVSEETGIISVAHKGELKRDFDSITLKTELENMLTNNEETSKPVGGMLAFVKRRFKK